MKNMNLPRSQSGFTLIELLIVIVIIGILSSAVISVINPAQQQRKAKEAVMKANVDKGCLALFACGATISSATACDTRLEAGLRDGLNGQPAGSTYALSTSNNAVADITTAAAANATLYFVGTVGTCVWSCGYNPSTGAVTNLDQVSADGTCL